MQKRIDEIQKRVLTEEEKKRVLEMTNVKPPLQRASTGGIDYMAEARKSARILGCVTQDMRVDGVQDRTFFSRRSAKRDSRLP